MVHAFARVFLDSIIRIYIGKIHGTDNLPKNASFIVAANHVSYADDVLMPHIIIKLLNKRIRIFVNSRYFRNYFLRKFLEHYGCIPVDVKKDVPNDSVRRKRNEGAYKIARGALSNGEIFGIFPEGERSIDGKLKKAKMGVAKMALEAKAPVVPMGIKGSYEIMPKGAIFPRFKKAEIFFGKPLYFNEYYGKEKDYKTLEKVTTSIMKELAKLIGQEYNY